MKTHLSIWTLLLFIAAIPCLADGHENAEAEEKEDTVLGTWYAQVADGEAMPPGMTMQLDILDNGIIVGTMSMGGGERDIEKWSYSHDEKNAKLTLYEMDDEGNAEPEIEVVLSYSFVDDMLILTFREDGDDDEEQRMELTRNKEGTERHQKMREEAGEEAGEEPQE